MVKYDLILFAAQSEEFVERLRELGLVDITTTGWEPSEEDRQILLDIEGHAKAAEFIAGFKKEAKGESLNAEPFATPAEAYEHYLAAQQQAAALRAEIARLEKLADELRPWGAFDVQRAARLTAQGIVLRYFSAQSATFDELMQAESTEYTLAEVERNESTVWFVAVTAPGVELSFDAQEMKAPTMDISEAERQIADNKQQLSDLDAEFARVAASEELLKEGAAARKEQLQTIRVQAMAEKAADDRLLVMEAWAEEADSEKVDALLEEYPNVVYIKSNPTPEDNTPVKLKNNAFAQNFELIGDMYARPKYGTMDLTPYFAPFYMLFFGICLNDAGYGLVLLAAGLFMLWKFREPGMMRRASWFATLCAASTVIFGGLCGSFFGMNLKEFYPDVPFIDFQNQFFSLSLTIGVVQILFGMALNLWTKCRAFGFGSILGSLGWFILLLSSCLAMGVPMITGYTIPGFAGDSIAYYTALGIGAVLMLVLNDLHRNPLVNIAAGVWDLYNNITGLLSDVLSYIRLFAIGLSGGVLALVFNSLADGFVPEGANIVVRLLIMIPILLIGHGINLFMSTISSFVHPLRLTFVEFYKNAGFEIGPRIFDPIRRMKE